MHISGTFPRFSKVSDKFNSPKLLFLPAKRLEIALFCVWNEKTVCQKKQNLIITYSFAVRALVSCLFLKEIPTTCTETHGETGS